MHEACTPPGVLSSEILRLPKPAAVWGVFREVQKYAIPAGHFDADLEIIFCDHFYILNFDSWDNPTRVKIASREQ